MDDLSLISEDTIEDFKKEAKKALREETTCRKGFEERLHEQWKEPLDLLEILIGIAAEVGQRYKDKLHKATDCTNAKFVALVKIHARALQVSNEILALLRGGYADGANARWRSLYELAVVSFLLKDNDNEVSRRYLDHEVAIKFKDAKDYQKYCKQLNYPPFDDEEFAAIKEAKEKICEKYGDKFEASWGWIPKFNLADRNFRALATHVGLDRDIPFYNLSAAAVHGLSRGFYRLGLPSASQDKMLLAGASLFGLADPLQLTAIHLNLVTVSFLNLKPDFETTRILQIMNDLVTEIAATAVDVQSTIENNW